MMREYNYHFIILNQIDTKKKKKKKTFSKNINKSLNIQLSEQTHFASEKTKHAKILEWIIGIVNVLILMETKNYM